MSRTLVQPVGQKRLTNVAVVRLKTHGKRFEIACFKNKVLSWRSGIEKDIDEVLQTHTVYINVSKAVLAKTKDLMEAFGTTDVEKICLEILNKGELQVAGKERDLQLSTQFRDVAKIVMEKTVNSETKRPYTISMIERFMREVHFALDLHKTSKKQALELIRELQKHFPITRAEMMLKLSLPEQQREKVVEHLNAVRAKVESEEKRDGVFSVVFRIDPGEFRLCDAFARECSGRLEIISTAVKETEDDEDNEDNAALQHYEVPSVVDTLGQQVKAVRIAPAASSSGKRCTTCDTLIEDAAEFREHYKSSWHKHNLKRKTRQLPPLSAEECLLDTTVLEHPNDMHEYSR